MKYKDWSNYKLNISGISKVMPIPVSAKPLTGKQSSTYSKLLSKEEKSEKESETFNILSKRLEASKNPPLSQTAKSYLAEIYGMERYGKRKAAVEFQKYSILKGTSLENEAVELLKKLHKIDYKRPDKLIENDFFKGRGDCLCIDGVNLVEVKISWNAATFFKNLNTKMDAHPWYQTQGYLDLYNLDHARVCYVLVNTPPHLVEQEIAKIYRKYTYGEIDYDQYQDYMDKAQHVYNYDSIPLRRRVITFDIYRHEETIERAKSKVLLCREWLNEFERKHLANKNIVPLAEDYVKIRPENNTESDSADSCESDTGGSDLLSD